MNRIRRVLDPQTRPQPRTLSPALAAVILLAMGAAAYSWQSPTTPQTPMFAKWLNEDVVYIIADAERAAFERLRTGEERQEFVDQFWRRRDPNPATAVNEFKEEHYRRIAYANQRFRTQSGGAGWRTARGQMYILYGPPDEIESHPAGSAEAYASEVWLYRRLERIGTDRTVTFVDKTGQGDYQWAPGKFC